MILRRSWMILDGHPSTAFLLSGQCPEPCMYKCKGGREVKPNKALVICRMDPTPNPSHTPSRKSWWFQVAWDPRFRKSWRCCIWCGGNWYVSLFLYLFGSSSWPDFGCGSAGRRTCAGAAAPLLRCSAAVRKLCVETMRF